jgi:hypothetical protein
MRGVESARAGALRDQLAHKAQLLQGPSWAIVPALHARSPKEPRRAASHPPGPPPTRGRAAAAAASRDPEAASGAARFLSESGLMVAGDLRSGSGGACGCTRRCAPDAARAGRRRGAAADQHRRPSCPKRAVQALSSAPVVCGGLNEPGRAVCSHGPRTRDAHREAPGAVGISLVILSRVFGRPRRRDRGAPWPKEPVSPLRAGIAPCLLA